MVRDVASELAACVTELATDWAVKAADLDLPIVALGHLASRMIAIKDSDQSVDFRPAFAEVERRLSTGDESERELLITGFLESLQNLDAARADRWVQCLGPSTANAWHALDEMWAGRMRPKDFNQYVEGSRDIHRR